MMSHFLLWTILAVVAVQGEVLPEFYYVHPSVIRATNNKLIAQSELGKDLREKLVLALQDKKYKRCSDSLVPMSLDTTVAQELAKQLRGNRPIERELLDKLLTSVQLALTEVSCGGLMYK